MTTATTSRGAAMARYFELIERFPLRPIRNRTEFKRAIKLVDRFAVADEGSLSEEEQDYFETLVLLVEYYESKNDPVDTCDVDPIKVRKHLMGEQEMTTTKLGKLIGSKGIASEVLNGKRSLSKSHIAKLAAYFSVDASVFFPVPRR